MSNRAYSLLTLKSVDEEKRVLTGIATTPSTDRSGDVVEPKGAEFDLPIPFLWQHDSSQPIGHVIKATVGDGGIEVEIQIASIDTPGPLKDRLDEAWQSIKAGLVRGLSIGFSSLESARIEGTYGLRYLKWLWLELSAVTIAANGEASIQTIKSIDQGLLAASGARKSGVVRLDTPGVTGTTKTSPNLNVKEISNMTIQEQIAAFKAKRTASSARATEILQKSADEGRTLDTDESAEYEDLQTEIKDIDTHLVRLQDHEAIMIKNAVAVPPAAGVSSEAASRVRSGQPVTVKSNLPKGTAFTRFAMALMRSKGNLMQAEQIAKGWNDSTPEVETILKAAVAAGTTTDSAWAAPLVEYQNMTGEFIELLRPQTIIGRIENLRRVPFNIKMSGQTGGSTVGWVGEGKPKPVSALAFNQVTLRFTKVAGIVVMSDELVRFSNPSSEALVSQDLRDTIAQFLDVAFVDPSKAEVADVSPASITNGATAITASGTDSDALKADVRAVFAAFIAANLTPANGVWIMSATTALAISEMTNPLGQPEFPGLTMTGGVFRGLPAVVSEAVGNIMILVNASDILLADDGQVVIDSSSEASLEMSDAPTGSGTLKSLWQNNLVGLRAERFINWKRRRAQAVAYITGVNYGGVDAGAGAGG